MTSKSEALPLSYEMLERLDTHFLTESDFKLEEDDAEPFEVEPLDIVDFLLNHLYDTRDVLRSQLQKQPECNICLKQFKASEQVRLLPCKHLYHSKCVDVWLTEVKGSCAVCRDNVRVKAAKTIGLA
jgi:hypothetical protein